MLNSEGFMGEKGVLEPVRVAAYCPKRLNRNLVLMANIPNSVDAILEPPIGTCRVAGFLLLGIVRIYSKKVEFMCNECDRFLLELNEFAVKKTNTTNEDISVPSPSITRPNTFQLDAFDLQIPEERICSHVRPSEVLMIEGARKDAEFSHQILDKNYSPNDGLNFGTFSAAFTPFSDVLSSQFRESEILESPSCTFHALEASLEKLRDNNSFLLDEMLDPIIRDGEQMGVPNVEKHVGVDEGPSSVAAYDNYQDIMVIVEKIGMVSPGSMEDHQALFVIGATPKLKEPNASSIEKHVEEYAGVDEVPPLVRAYGDDQEMNSVETIMVSRESIIDHQASVTIDSTPKLKDPNTTSVGENIEEDIGVDQDMDTVEEIGIISPESTTGHEISISIDATPNDPDTSSVGNYVGFDEVPSSVEEYEEDQDMDTVVQSNFRVMVTPESRTDRRASVDTDAPPLLKGTNASGTSTPAFMSVKTPAAKECSRFSRKRKSLVDDVCVLRKSFIKESIANPRDLVRARSRVPHARLRVWKIQKISNLPHSLLEPLIPCSSRLGSVFSFKDIKKVQALEATEAPQTLNILDSPIIDLSPEKTMDILEPLIIHQSPDQELNTLEPQIDHQSRDRTNIAPLTPISFSSSSRFLEGTCQTISSDSVEEEDGNENIECDDSLTSEDISSPAGDSWEMNKWSARTQSAARCLCRNFVSQKTQTQEDAASLFQILNGKKKRDSARLFYEVLVLKSGGYLDVKQEEPYDDIVVAGTSKLNKFSDF